jgi:hypothetical protein
MTHPRLVAMRRRVALIRRTVAACAVAVFIALFATIYVQMAAGHDPALASTTTTTTAASSQPTPVTTAQS